jgi:MoaA/NifB/PqqE/SkfB family radical SAM enzyme
MKSAAPQPRTIQQKRSTQVLHSVPHYARELMRVRNPREIHAWFYTKLPYAFPRSGFPTLLNLEPTNECNFGCKQCPRTMMNRSLGDMEPQLFRKIIEEVQRHPTCIVKLVGLGEPSIHPNFPELMGILRENRTHAICYTNGTMLERYPHREVLDWRLRRIVVSVDGLDAESFERIRVNGNYASIRDAVGRFHALKKKTLSSRTFLEIRHVIMPNETPEQLEEFKADWLSIADSVKFNYLIPAGPAMHNGNRPRCRDIRREFYIRWDGQVPLCGYQYLSLNGQREWIGDLHKTSITDLWNNHPRLNEVRALHLKRDLDSIAFCKTCAFR